MKTSSPRFPQLAGNAPEDIRRWLHTFRASPKEDSSAPSGIPLNHPQLTQCLSHGRLPTGILGEVVTPHPSGGGQLFLESLLLGAVRIHRYMALIDACDTFAPASVPEACFPFLLWIRCRHTKETLRAADILIRDENFPLTIIDLRQVSTIDQQRIPNNQWYRIQRTVRQQGSTCMVFTRRASIAAAQLRLELSAQLTLVDHFRPRNQIWEQHPIHITRQRQGLDDNQHEATA